MCSGAREHKCWCGATFFGPLAAQRITTAIIDEVEKLGSFDANFFEILQQKSNRLDEDRQKQLKVSRERISRIETEMDNVVRCIRGSGGSERLGEELRKLEEEKGDVSAQIACIELLPRNTVEIPPAHQIRDMIHESVTNLATESAEFGNILRKLVPRILVFPVQLCDGGPVVMRGKFQLFLANALSDRRAIELLRGPLSRVVTVDLFQPPQREKFRRQILIHRAAGMTERQAAAACGITVTAAQRAAVLQRKMGELGIADPYVAVSAPGEDCPRLRRHRHADYSFEALIGGDAV